MKRLAHIINLRFAMESNMRKVILMFIAVIFIHVNVNASQIDSLGFIADTMRTPALQANLYLTAGIKARGIDGTASLCYLNACENVSKSYGLDSMFRKVFLLKADLFFAVSHFDSVKYYSNKLIGAYQSSGTDKASSYYYLGEVASREDSFDLAVNYLSKSIEISKENNHLAGLFALYHSLATAYTQAEDYDQALKYYFEALEIQMQNDSKNTWFLSAVWGNISYIYSQMGDYESALTFSQKCLAPLKESKNIRELSYAYVDLSGIHLALGNLDSTEYYLEKALPIAEEQNLIAKLYLIHLNYANFYKEKKESKKALESLLHSKQYLDQFHPYAVESLMERIGYGILLGDLYMDLGSLKDAETSYQESLGQAVKLNKLNQLKEPHLRLAKLYKKLGKYQKSFYHLETYTELNDSLFSSERKARFERLEKEYESELKEKEISKLEVEKALEESRAKQIQQRVYLLIGLVVLIFLVSGFILFFFSQRKEKERLIVQKNLEAQEAKVQELVQNQALKSIDAMLEGQENERVRVARDLHDRLGSTMSMIKLHYSEVVDQLENVQLVNQSNFLMVNDLVDEAISEVRRISHNMSAGTLMEYGLVPALYELKNTIESSRKIELILHVFNLDFRLKSVAEINLYRVIQEMVNNTLKHAQATQIEISLTKRDNVLSLMYDDNGVGVKPENLEEYKSGMGLKNIKSRIEKLEGKVHLNSELGKGIHYDIEIPIEA